MPRQPPRVALSPGKSHEEVCRLCLPPLGCREVPASAETCDVRLVVGETEHEAALQQNDGSLLNKYAGMWDMCRKVPFARMMERMRQLYPDDFAFVPRTWVLPGDAAPTEGRRKLIVKPDGGSQGDGIFVASGWEDARCRLAAHGSGCRECPVSHYLGDPLLLGGLKFDLRVYVVVSSLLPLRVHLCREGLARFATQPYADASGRELSAHLTNYSLNVRTAGFEHNDDPDDGANGSKRTLSATLLECATPAHARPGVLALELSANGQDFSADEVLFEYQQSARLDDVAPSRGPIGGGSSVALGGAGFSRRSAMLGHAYARFNVSKVPVVHVSASELRCVAPPSPLAGSSAILKAKLTEHARFLPSAAIRKRMPAGSGTIGSVPIRSACASAEEWRRAVRAG